MIASTSRRGDYLLPFLGVAIDSVAIEFAFLVSYWLRSRSGLFDLFGFTGVDAPPISAYLLGSLFIVPAWLLLFQARKMYGIRRSVTLADEIVNVVKIVSFGMLIVMSAAFFYRAFSYSRIVFGLLWVTSILFISSGRVLLLGIERTLYRQGRNLQHGLLIGSGELANQVYRRLDRHPSFGFHLAGYFADTKADPSLELFRCPYLGPVSSASAYIRHEGIEIIFLAVESIHHERVADLVTECEGLNVEFMMVPDVLDLLASRVTVRELEGIPFLRIKTIPFSAWGRILKRAIDVAASSVLLVLLSPVWLLLLVMIPLTSRGTPVFKQERVGLDGRKFTMFKFRSMKRDAEAVTGPVWTHKGDVRRTWLGVFLRKTSLDELPQLFNVLKGDMSLVGPRPERSHFVDQFRRLVPKYLDRLRVKAGMTGWAQVNGLRGDTSLEERIKYDLYYIENWSVSFDMKILLRTMGTALRFRHVD
jgi:exopolysaccharide biosynthesis polyprenyl glycosylphosphotransferase